MYAGAGLIQFTDDPRDQAADWLESNGEVEATMTVFKNSPAKVGLVHGQQIDHYQFGQVSEPGEPFTEWIISTPNRTQKYLQVTSNMRNMEKYPRREMFHTRLINNNHQDYVVAAEFGERSENTGRLQNILNAGISPTIEKRTEYVVVLERKT